MLSNKKMCFIFVILIILFLSMTSVSSTDDITNTSYVEENVIHDSTDNQFLVENSLQKNNITDNNLKTQTNEDKYIYVNVNGNPSSDGRNISNPTTLNKAINHVKNEGIILLQDNGEKTYYDVTQNLTVYNLNSSINKFTITSNNPGNVIIRVFSNNLIRFNGNYHITLSNISFTRSINSTLPVIYNNVNLTLDNCNFYGIENSYRYGSIYTTKTLTLLNSNFYNNTAQRQGAAVYAENTTVNIKNCTFDYNHAENGAAISSINSKINITGTLFTSNNASFGGIFSLRDNSQLNVDNSSFINNTAKYYGGVLDSWYSTSLFNNSVFMNNLANCGAVTYSVNNIQTKILNSLLENNVADVLANNVYAYRDNLTLNNNVIISPTQSESIYTYNVSYNIDNNWWGTNNPNFYALMGDMIPNTWRLMTIYLENGSSNRITVSLKCLSNSQTTNADLYTRKVTFRALNQTLNLENSTITSAVTNNYNANLNDLEVSIDNQTVKLNQKLTPYLHALDIAPRINDNITITLNCNPEISTPIELRVNNTVIGVVTAQNGVAEFGYNFDSLWNKGTYTLTASITNNTKYEDTTVSSTFNLVEYEPITLVNRYSEEVQEEDIKLKSGLSLDYIKQYQTSVKDQAASGSCWAFNAMATLESAYLKTYGIEYNFSENNMKNILKRYSKIGDVYYYPDSGNSELEAIAYLVGWRGPVNESDDPYDDYSIMSPVLDNILKVEDVYFYYRNTSKGNDNKALKEAIMRYGALASSIYASYSGTTGTNLYTTMTPYADHAITIVGWDDFYSQDNFNGYNKPAGRGAYIIKNSWGTDVGLDGYQYVSYYDTSLAGVGMTSLVTSFSYTFPLQTYENYTNIYQHDTISTDVETIESPVWIRNVYTAQDHESIGGVGTFIYEPTEYEVYVYVNDDLYYTQEGNITQEGYRIIKLDKYVQVNPGDVFHVDLKLKAFEGKYTIVTLQNTQYYKSISKPNQSFLSTDGERWEDLFTSTEYPNSAACLKVYTKKVATMNTTLQKENNYQLSTEITNIITPGKLTYKIDGEYVTDSNGNIVVINVTDNGVYNFTIKKEDIQKFNFNISVIFATDDSKIYDQFRLITPLNLTLTTQNYTYYYDDEQTIIAQVSMDNNTTCIVNEGKLLLTDGQTIISQANIINGSATFSLRLNPGEYVYTIKLDDSEAYTCSDVTTNIIILKHDVILEITSIENNTINDKVVISGLIYLDNNQTISKTLHVNIDGQSYSVKSDKNGEFVIQYPVNTAKQYTVIIISEETTQYHNATLEYNFTVDKKETSISVDDMGEVYVGNLLNITGWVLDEDNSPVSDVLIRVYDNNNLLGNTSTDENGLYSYEYLLTVEGLNNIKVVFDGNDVYGPSESEMDVVVGVSSINTTITVNPISQVAYNDQIELTGQLTDINGNLIDEKTITLEINNELVNITTDNGVFRYVTVATTIGTNNITVCYDGDEDYCASEASTTFEVGKKMPRFYFYTINDTLEGSTYKITGKLPDGPDAIGSSTITLNVNGEDVTVTLNNDGYFKYFATAVAGVNNITATFDGSDVYAQSMISTMVYAKAKVRFYFYAIGDTVEGSAYKITGKLLGGSKGIGGAIITLNINGKNVTVTTTNDGYFKYTATAVAGVNNITATFDGSDVYVQAVNKTKVNAKAKVRFYFYAIGDTVEGSAYKITGKLLGGSKGIGGAIITLNINGKNVTVTTANDGYFKYTTTVKSGINNITATYEGSDVYIPAVIKTKVNAKAKVRFYFYVIGDTVEGSTYKITGKLPEGPYAIGTSTITLNVNGEDVTVTLNSDGYFKYTTTAKAGINNITATYGGSEVYGPSVIKTTVYAEPLK